MEQRVIQLEQQVELLRQQLTQFVLKDKFYFTKDVVLADKKNISTNTSTGSSLGGSSSQKVSVYGVTPVIQASLISAPSGGATVDSQARAAINSIITAIKNFGITA